MNDVRSWLRNLGLEQYAEIFADQAIESDVLPDLTDRDLASLEIPLGHRKRLLKAAGKLSSRSPETEAPGPERRYLTVVFCDLVGSTALARQLDPEDVRLIMRAYQDCCAGIVARLDGLVSRYIGDGVLIYFGFPRAHEDDAERALRASLEIVATVSRLTTGTGEALQSRVGVATGLVVVGDLVGAGPEITAVGDPLNIASRLQSLAVPNGIVVDDTTRRLTGGLFTFADLGEQPLKGVSEPVQVWALTGETGLPSRFEATRGGRAVVPFVGRDKELAKLLDAWNSAKRGAGRLVLLSGEPGIGKSRLVQVFETQLAGEAHTRLLLQSSPYHQNTPLYPFVEYVRRVAGLQPGDSPKRKLEKIGVYFADVPAMGEALKLFAGLLSIPEDKADLADLPDAKDNAIRVLRDHFRRLSADAPLLVVVEDAQWFDPTSIELLDAIADRVRDARAVVLVTYRSDFALPLARRHEAVLVQLNRLRRPDCQAMIEHIADRKAVPAPLLNEIVARADGVALFVEELTKTVLESEILVDRGDRYELKGTMPAVAIPATLNGSLMARLDRSPQTREIAQVGAVIGREFTYSLLVAVAEKPEADTRDALAGLVKAELLLPAGEPPDATYRFKHALVQDAAYESSLLSRRRTLHARAARVIEDRFPDIVAAQPALLAQHFARAGMAARAIAYCLRAGRLAVAQAAMAEAIAVLHMGLDLLQGLSARSSARRLELELQVLLGHALRAARAPSAPETGAAWERARALCRDKRDSVYLEQALYGQFLFSQGNADLARARQLGEELLAHAEKQRNRTAFVRGNSAVGRTAFGQGDFDGARRHLEQALSVPDRVFRRRSKAVQAPESRVLNLCYLAWTLFVQGHASAAVARCDEFDRRRGTLVAAL